ncbi:MAG TPA: ABC transporter permease [Streptosporangiaceae bacterium]|nr:ABC transporter permease [Streptosporangiaceae bacterium]
MTPGRFVHITINELRGRARDYTLLVVALVGPVVFATITSLAFASFDNPKPVRLVVTTGTASSASNSLVRGIQRDSLLQQAALVRVTPSVAQAQALVRDGGADAGLLLPAQSRLGPGGTPEFRGVAEVLETQQQPLAGEVAEVALQTIGGQDWLRHVVLKSLNGLVPEDSSTLRRLAPKSPVTLTDGPASSRSLTAATYYGSSMAIVFLLFVVTPMAKSLWTERQNKTLDRLLASGVSRWAIVVSKAASAQVIGTLSVTAVWVASTFAFHASWGNPLAVFLLISVTVAAAAALSFGIATAVRTEASMDGAVATVTFVIVLAGGNFVPPAALPDGLRQLSLVTPNGWALRGFLDLATSAGGVGAIGPTLLAILAFTVVIWLVIAARLRKLTSP